MKLRHVVIPALSLFIGSSFSVADPEVPILRREVTTLINKQHQRPHIPPVRTSLDGRIGMNQRIVADSVQFYLLNPESLTRPLLAPGASPGTAGMVKPFTASLAGRTAPQSDDLKEKNFFRTTNPPAAAGMDGKLSFYTLCDPSQGQKPSVCADDSSKDCYYLKVISGRSFIGTTPSPSDHMQLVSTPVTIVVKNPKTPNAEIEKITSGLSTLGPDYRGFRQLREPMVTDDGRLLVSRAGDGSRWSWNKPVAGTSTVTTVTGVYDIFYAYNSTRDPCDVRGWTTPMPITHAPFDTAVSSRYLFAARPFRDTEGAYIPDGVDLKATYPWIDRKGRNLFFTTLGASLYYRNPNGAMITRYPTSCPPGVVCAANPTTTAAIAGYDEPSITRGTSIMGFWTHGKMVFLDGLLNNIDFGTRGDDEFHRNILLYDPGTDPTYFGRVRIGASREFESYGLVTNNVLNTTFVESLENLFNFNVNYFPRSNRDVIWTMSNGKATAEVVFDDYLNTNTFIFSEMTGSLSFTGSPLDGRMLYRDGFVQTSPTEGSGFTGERRIQNASPAVGWTIPPYGAVLGSARLEPVALGGIQGRGLWLEATDSVRYDVPAQAATSRRVENYPWFIGLFLDPRFSGTGNRRILTFPDGSALESVGLTGLRLVDRDGVLVVLFPVSLVAKKWVHLGLLVESQGQKVTLYWNGFPKGRWEATGTRTLFRLVSGALYVGKRPGLATLGLRGWIDNFLVVGEKPAPEVICNHARGTLAEIGSPVLASYPDPLGAHLELAKLTPSSVAAANRRFVCYTDYSREEGTSWTDLPKDGLSSLRMKILFPAGLHARSPRPDTRTNGFCLSCHQAASGTLSLQALAPHSEDMEQDSRRQPLQPPRYIYGNIPAAFCPANQPDKTATGPCPIPDASGVASTDRWIYP